MILFFVLIASVAETLSKELTFVHVVYRHGARGPSRVYPNDPHKIGRWPNGLKQLTQIVVRSSNSDRALQSASANLAGFFQPKGYQVWNRDMKWQPIPVHCDQPTDQDLLVKPTSVACPAFEKLYARHSNLVLDAYNKNYTIAENLTQPDWVFSRWNGTGSHVYGTVWDMIREMKRIVRLCKLNSPSLSKILGGYLLNDILERMKKRTKGTAENPSKMFVYSTHSGTMLALMYNMGIQNDLLLPFSSSIMIELYTDTNSKNTVEIYLKNDTSAEVLFQLEVPGCAGKTVCSFDLFYQSLQHRVYKTRQDWADACGVTEKNSGDLKGTIVMVLAVVSIVLFLSLISLVLCVENKKTLQYSVVAGWSENQD